MTRDRSTSRRQAPLDFDGASFEALREGTELRALQRLRCRADATQIAACDGY
jgi:hypothetical protein